MFTKPYSRQFLFKHFTTLILSLLLFFISCQENPRPRRGGMDPEQALAELKDRLDLSEQQVQKADTLLKNYSTKMRELFRKNRGDREVVIAAREEIQIQLDNAIEDILTEQQVSEYIKLIKERKERIQQRREQRRQRLEQ